MTGFAPSDAVLVVGGGRVGRTAVEVALASGARTFLADRDPACAAVSLLPPDRFFRCTLEDALAVAERIAPAWVVPAVPRHLLAHWFAARHPRLVPHGDSAAVARAALPPDAVLGSQAPSATLVLSLAPADQRCPEDCVPPEGVCALTRKPRPQPLFALLRACLEGAFDRLIVLESHQIAGGLGALSFAGVTSALSGTLPAGPAVVAVGTASACHGLLTMFKVGEK